MYFDLLAIIHRIGKFAVTKHVNHAAYRLLGVILNMPHIGKNGIETELCHHLVQLLQAFFIGGKLGTQIGNILLGITRWIFCPFQNCHHLVFTIGTCIDHLEIIDQHTFFVDMRRVWWCRPGRTSADIRMTTTPRNQEHTPPVISFEHRRNNGYIRQMCPPIIGVVQNKGVTRVNIPLIAFDDRANTFSHRPKMHRHMRGIGD